MDLKDEFDLAVKNSKDLPAKPDNETLLKLYSLYKQATEGDVNTDPPSGFDFVGLAKHTAWSSQKGKSREMAMSEYVLLVNSLLNQ
jgi:diazepam-binding inhibitor (GABA receptor modulator, acyl-CoA-binding protein)